MIQKYLLTASIDLLQFEDSTISVVLKNFTRSLHKRQISSTFNAFQNLIIYKKKVQLKGKKTCLDEGAQFVYIGN